MFKLTLLVAAMAVTGPAAARDEAPGESVKVSVRGLDLNTQEGRAALDRRIGDAIDSVCPARYDAVPRLRAKVKACRLYAAQGAERQVTTRFARLQVAPPANAMASR